jgi:hypothetical protein
MMPFAGRPRAVETRAVQQLMGLGDVAQLVEHLVRNEGVTGSNPVISTTRHPILSRPRANMIGTDGPGLAQPELVNPARTGR